MIAGIIGVVKYLTAYCPKCLGAKGVMCQNVGELFHTRAHNMAIETRFMELLRKKHPGVPDDELPTITAMSEAIEVQPRTISSWMKGHVERTHFGVLDKICEYLDCEPGDLIVRVKDK